MIRKEEDAKLWRGVKIGQTMNLQKSFLVFSQNIRHTTKREISAFFNLGFHSSLGKYLGTCIDCQDSKKQVVQETINKIEGKLKDWKARLLSQAARLTLIKSVVNSYLVFPLSPMLFSKIFWGNNGNHGKIQLQKWRDLCRPKDQGGLAFCDVLAFNQALLAKHVWRLIDHRNLLIDSTLSAKYMDRSNWGSIISRSNSSWRWKSIMKTKHVIIPNLEWQVGDGTRLRDRLVWKFSIDGNYNVRLGRRSCFQSSTDLNCYVVVSQKGFAANITQALFGSCTASSFSV
ncbi:ribonuclease H [Senna tora]|uniref:Ribonuclease H n=1 Tax=Senna tora TaxID=362788 RepID=A0A834T7C1_9FABA|nr:ribonuclease H [Senna tora]